MLSNSELTTRIVFLRGAMPTLYLLCDFWEPSLSRAAHEAKTIKNHTIHISHIKTGELVSKLAPLCEEMNKEDVILIAVLDMTCEERKALSCLLKKINSETVGEIKFSCSRYDPEAHNLITRLGFHEAFNIYETSRRSPALTPDNNHIVTIKERRWIQYRLMRALIAGENPKAVFEETIRTLLKKQISSKQFDLAQKYYDLGEPDMAGGNYAAEREKNPNAIDQLRSRAVQIGRSGLNALVVGETGTGKESIAWYLHDFSNRNLHPFLALNCAFFEGERLESELFGHEQGAFTDAKKAKRGLVEEANGGTIFLDELPEMNLRVQAKLLRFLQDGSFTRMGGTQVLHSDVRILSAAQPDRMKNLRPDLYHRIADVELTTTPLRQMRPDAIVNIGCNLAYRLMWHTALDEKGATQLTPDVIRSTWEKLSLPENAQCLAAYHWPGNMRELSNMIKRYVLLGDDIFKELRSKKLLYSSPSASYEIHEGDNAWKKFTQPVANIETIQKFGLKLGDLQGAFVRNLVLHLGGRDKVQLTKLAKILDCSYNTLNKYL